jgi:hypothetical protein
MMLLDLMLFGGNATAYQSNPAFNCFHLVFSFCHDRVYFELYPNVVTIHGVDLASVV